MRKSFCLGITALSAALSFMAPAHAHAADTDPLADRPHGAPPVLRYFEGNGVKLTYLGNQGGLSGYLAEAPGGKMQPLYVTPDGEHVVVGLLVRTGGMNETGLQISDMQKRWEAARAQLDDGKSGLGNNLLDHATGSANASISGDDAKPSAPADAKGAPAPAPASVTPASAPPPDASKVAASDADASAPYLSHFSKDKFLKDVSVLPWFSVGSDQAPVVYMVADPNCPFCHKAWHQMKKLVVDGKLRVNVILIGALKGSEEKAVSILSRPEPGKAWFIGEGSDEGYPVQALPMAGTKEFIASKKAISDAQTYLDINMEFARHYMKHGTPFLAYVGKDGKLYSAEGPSDLGAFLAAL